MLFLWLWFRFVRCLVILNNGNRNHRIKPRSQHECPSNKVQETTRCEPTLKNAVPGHQNDTRNKVGRHVTLDSYKSRFTIARRSGLWPYFARNIRSPLTASYRCSLSVRVGTSLIPTLLTQPPHALRSSRLVFTIILYPLLLSLYRRVVRCSRYLCAAEILHIDCKSRFFLFNVYRV